MSDELVGALLAGWTGRWRHPDLAAELVLTAGPVDVERAVGLLVAGLARSRTYAESLDALLAAGRFEAADAMLLDLLDQSPSATAAGGDRWQDAADRLAAARADTLADLRRQWVDLEIRAASLRLDPVPEPDLAAAADRSRDDGLQLLAPKTERVEAAEKDRVKSVDQRIGKQLAAQVPTEVATAWAAAVRECLAAGEYDVVEALLAAGPDAGVNAGPRTVPLPPLRWPWPERPAAEILGWYGPGGSPGPEFERYRPVGSDPAWPRLRDELVRIVATRDGPVVRDVAIALAGLLGDQAAPPVETVTDPASGAITGYRTRLFGLRDARMPLLPLLRYEGVAVWVSADDDGGETVPGPPPVTEPVLWLRPCTSAARSGDPYVAVLDLAGLFLVVAPDARRRAPEPATLRVNLLRLLVPQLVPAAVLGGPALDLGPGAAARDSLAWLFDLFGLRPDGPVLDGVLHDTGGHPTALRCLLDELLTAVLDVGEARVGLPALRAVRGPGTHGRIRDALVAPLAADGPARTVLWLALWQDGDGELAPEQVLATLDLVELSAEVRARVAEHLPVPRAFATLSEMGLLCGRVGAIRLPAAGLRLILRGDDATVRTLATDAVVELAESIRVAGRAAAAILGERVTHTIGHKVDNHVAGIRRTLEQLVSRTADADDRATLAALAARVEGRLGGRAYVNAYEKALEPPARMDVADLVRAVPGEVDWDPAREVRIRVDVTGPVHVVANHWILNEAVGNLVRNAETALRRTAGPSTIRICVREHAGLSPDAGLLLPPPCVAIEVADGGPGFTDEDLGRYRDVLDGVPAAATDVVAEPPGTGLRQTHAWLRDYGGTLELAGRSADLGGACVRMWLPVDAAPTRGESA